MPPNPARQARMAERRAQMENDPELQRAARDAGQAVLDSYNEAPVVDPVQRAPAPSRPASTFRGGGGGSGFKQNTGRKGALPAPDYDIKLFNYKNGGKVIKSERY